MTYLNRNNDKNENQRNASVFHANLELIGARCVYTAHESQYAWEDDECEEESLRKDADRVPVPDHNPLFLRLLYENSELS